MTGGPHALITAAAISRNREGIIRCPHCPETFPRWYRGTLHIGPDYLTGMRLSGYRKLSEHMEQEHSPADKLAPDWRILLVRDDWYELQFNDPAMGQWHCMFEAPSPELCKRAYDIYQEGEKPPEFTDTECPRGVSRCSWPRCERGYDTEKCS